MLCALTLHLLPVHEPINAHRTKDRDTQQKTRFDYGFGDASLPAQTTVPKAKNTVPARIRGSAGSQEFTTFQQTGSIDTGACESGGSHSHTPSTHPRTAKHGQRGGPELRRASDTTTMRGEFSGAATPNVKADGVEMESICVGAFASPTPKGGDAMPFSPRSEIECATEAAKSMAHTEAGNYTIAPDRSRAVQNWDVAICVALIYTALVTPAK